MAAMEQIHITIKPGMKEDFYRICKENHTNSSTEIKKFIEEYIDNNGKKVPK